MEFRVSELIFLSIDDSRAWSITRSGLLAGVALKAFAELVLSIDDCRV